MEMYELRYFLGVAREENVTRASEKMNVSAASLSKAISRLESELSVQLFSREGRQIRLTDQGRLFQLRASDIVSLEESARLELAGHHGQLRVVIAGPEVLISGVGFELVGKFKRHFKKCVFEFQSVDDELALKQVLRGEAHLAIVTTDIAAKKGLSAKTFSETQFQTVVGVGHPLYSAAKSGRPVHIDQVLEFPFASPNHALLGKVGMKQSLDGWRDDKFPRRIEYLTSSLKLLEDLVTNGTALAYLPDYFAKKIGVKALNVEGCPYICLQKVRVAARNLKDHGWLKRVFD
jgi:DNA-binding transcriptional LysR family regulator